MSLNLYGNILGYYFNTKIGNYMKKVFTVRKMDDECLVPSSSFTVYGNTQGSTQAELVPQRVCSTCKPL